MTANMHTKVFNNDHLLAVSLPSNNIYEWIEFKRIYNGKQEYLGKLGWSLITQIQPRKIYRDKYAGDFFCYYLDQKVYSSVSYLVRTNYNGVYSQWEEMEECYDVFLPPPTSIRKKAM